MPDPAIAAIVAAWPYYSKVRAPRMRDSRGELQ